jgi:hypothetical protein
MEIGSEFFSSTKIAEPRALPRPKLLLELEPAHRVFFGNLLDTLLFRPAPRVATTSRPGRFWPDVFIEPEMPWWGFLESMLWHMLVVAGIWSISQGVALRNQPFQRPSVRRTYISYYRPSPTFPVAAARAPRPEPSPAVRKGSARHSALKVVREGRRGIDADAAPSLKLGRKGSPNLAGVGGSLPEMPFSATTRSRLSVPAGPNALVAPPPEVYEVAGRRGGLPQASVVAPPPDASALAARRGLGAPGTAVVEPPPSVQGALRKFGDVNIGHAEVVAPAPQLPMHEQRAGLGVEQAGLGGSSVTVVPPPPSVQRSGTLRGGRGGSMASSGMQVVPPPPSVQEAGKAGVGRAGALSSNSVQVVPPPPSVEGIGDSAGRGQGTALTGDNFGVVPPAPSARGIGSPAGRGRGTSPAVSGLQVVPPPPSIDGGGNGAGGSRGTAISGGGLEVVPPAPSTRGLGGSGGGSGRGGSLGGTGLQASGPAINGQGFGAMGGRGGNGGSSGKGSSAGAGTEMASASGNGSGGVGRGSGAGASGHAVGTGNGNGEGEAASGTSRTTGPGGTGGAAGGSGEASGSSPGSAAGGGNSAGSGASASAAGNGSPNGSPNGSNPDGVNISGGGRPIAADIPRARPPILDNPPGPQDLPVRVIGLAMSLPSSSYFSNYEVFIAERRISKDESQLIKLVYQSLPYQRRLSEYGLNNARVFKLRVIRDPSCDESLMQMTWPDADQSKSGSAPLSDSPELNSSGRSDKLPCYRTTADDYRRAISRRR